MMRWLFKLDSVPEGDSLRLGWLAPWPAWLWVLVVIGILLFVAWCYRGVLISQTWRISLAAARIIILLLVAILLNGPVLESPRQHRTSDQILVLLDRSGSMVVPDVEVDSNNRISRQAQMMDLLERSEPLWRELAEDRNLRWFGFHSHAFERVPGTDSVVPELTDPLGEHTRIDAAVARAIAMSAGGPVSAAIVLSDGRSDHELRPRHISEIRAAGVPVIAIPLGSNQAVGDLVLEQVTAPGRAFTGDRVPIEVAVTRRGAASEAFEIVLQDRRTGRELDRTRIEPGESSRVEATLLGIPDVGGTATWRVMIEPEFSDLVLENNQNDIDIDLLDEPLRVLYVEGGPRWEYRFLKNLLLREESIESSIMLLSADSSFAQEGDRPLSRLPVTAEEFEDFDVVIIGDVPSGVMSPEQHLLLQEAVGNGGAGLLWIGGEVATPESWGSTDLADVLPFNGPYDLPKIGSPVQIRPTGEADRLGVLQLSESGSSAWPNVLSDQQVNWSKLQWAQWIQAQQIKPTATILAETAYARDQDKPMPIVLGARYGLGRSIYVTTDETWRWRHGRGEQFGEQFWVQLIRHLGRASLSASRGLAELVPSHRQIPVGQILQIRMEVFDESMLLQLPDSISVAVMDAEDRLVTEVGLRRSTEQRDTWNGAWVPARPGDVRLSIDLPGLQLESEVRVEDISREYQRPEADHAALASLAEATGGQVLQPDQVDLLKEVLPDRSITEIDVQRAGLWDAPIIFLLLLVLLTVEWTARRLLRLA
ncbi:MAG: hypothetical protein VX527_01710 [Planctomycetota bacterium]|nr:hypothetical protein [Planctomycetota bacterium]